MSLSVEVNIKINEGAIRRDMRDAEMRRELGKVTDRVARIARSKAPGSMSRRIDSRVENDARGLVGVVECVHPAVHFVLNGTRPHLIEPKRARALRWVDGGDVIFARRVRHPGTKAQPFLQEALREGVR